MADRIGYLAESGYVTEGNIIRHGDVLRDMVVDYDKNIRVLGMIGLCDAEASQSRVTAGSDPLAYMILSQGGKFVRSKVRYTDPMVKTSGLDPELTNVKQAIRVEMFGHSVLTTITLTEG